MIWLVGERPLNCSTISGRSFASSRSARAKLFEATRIVGLPSPLKSAIDTDCRVTPSTRPFPCPARARHQRILAGHPLENAHRLIRREEEDVRHAVLVRVGDEESVGIGARVLDRDAHFSVKARVRPDSEHVMDLSRS